MGQFDRGNRGGGRSNNRGFGGRGSDRQEMHDAVCSECGEKCEVPFRPTSSKPVYCNNCFKRDSGSSSRGGSRDRGFGGRDRDSSGPAIMHKAVCDKCGEKCEVPFRPTSGKPVYCSLCFEKDSKVGGNKSNVNFSQLESRLEMLNAKIDKVLNIISSLSQKEVKKDIKVIEVSEPKNKIAKEEIIKKVVKKAIKKTTTKKAVVEKKKVAKKKVK